MTESEGAVPSDHARSTPGDLVQRLAGGWSAQAGLIDELVQFWRRTFAVGAEVIEIEEDVAYFQCSLDKIRLKGFSDLHCLLIGGEVGAQQLTKWKVRLSAPRRRILVSSLNDLAFLRAEPVFPAHQGFILLQPTEVVEVLRSASPEQSLKAIARKRLSPLRLNPFGILTVPEANMFFGRQAEVEILIQSEGASYAVAGPGRIGKTSLVHQFRRRLHINDPGRYSRTVYVDFMNCHETTDPGICQFLAIKINDGSRARSITPPQLDGFLRAERKLRQGPLELLLDEVDRVCESQTFRFLAEATKNEVCRLIMCGKGVLYENMHTPKSILCERLRLMRLSPLDEKEAQNLLLWPFEDLGIKVADPVYLVDEILKDTGRFPHLIQYFGGALVEALEEQRTDCVTNNMLDVIRENFETAQRFAGPILSLENPVSELIALALLHQTQTSFSETEIAHIARAEGLRVDEKEVSRICRELYINNVLLWEHDRYRIGNRAMSRYARKLGYFVPRLAELRKAAARGIDPRRVTKA
jgi:hypothetical protein